METEQQDQRDVGHVAAEGALAGTEKGFQLQLCPPGNTVRGREGLFSGIKLDMILAFAFARDI